MNNNNSKLSFFLKNTLIFIIALVLLLVIIFNVILAFQIIKLNNNFIYESASINNTNSKLNGDLTEGKVEKIKNNKNEKNNNIQIIDSLKREYSIMNGDLKYIQNKIKNIENILDKYPTNNNTSSEHDYKNDNKNNNNFISEEEMSKLQENIKDLNSKIVSLEDKIKSKNEQLNDLKEIINDKEAFLKEQLEDQYSDTNFSIENKNDIPGMLYYDDFLDNSREWIIGENEKRKLEILNGKYIFENKMFEGTWMIWNNTKLQTEHNNYKLTAVVQKLSGNNTGGYGILWKLKNNNNFLAFKITGNGYYRLERVINGKKNILIPWIYDTNINKGNNVNKLSVIQNNNYMELLINDKKVHTLEMPIVNGRNIGLIIDDKQTMSVDLIYIKKL